MKKSRSELVDEFVLLLGSEQQKSKSKDRYVSITIDEVIERLGLSTREEFDMVCGDASSDKLFERKPNPTGVNSNDGSMSLVLTIAGEERCKKIVDERQKAAQSYR